MADTTGMIPASNPSGLTKKEFADSKLFPSIGTPAKTAVLFALSRSYDLCPVAVASGLFFVGGKPSLSAQLIATLVRRSEKYTYRVREKTDKQCKIEFFEKLADGELDSLGIEIFTWAMATRAGLASGVNWKKYPEAMLFARALTAGVRTHCPDALGGNPVYSVEELSPTTEVDSEGRPLLAAQDDDDVIDAEVVSPVDVTELTKLVEEAGVKMETALQYLGVEKLEDASEEAIEKLRQFVSLKTRNSNIK